VVAQIEKILAQVLLRELVGRFARMLGELPHRAEIGLLGSGGQAAQLLVLDHPTA
jgi:hypothetical protein